MPVNCFGYDRVSLWGLIKQEALQGTAAQQYKSAPASQFFPSLFFFPSFLNALSRHCFWQSRGVELLSATPPGHLEGLQMCSSRIVDCSISGTWDTPPPPPPPMHPALAHFIYNQSTFQTQSENQILLCPSLWVEELIENAKCNQISWIKMSGLKMGDMSDNSHGSAWGMKRLVEIIGMWVWSVYELLMVCFGRQSGWSPLPSYAGCSYWK